jgi:hypothetical protein
LLDFRNKTNEKRKNAKMSNFTPLKIRNTSRIIAMILLTSVILIACSSSLPKEVKLLLNEKDSPVDIVSFQKARYPENYVFGFGVYKNGVDEAWCITYNFTDPNWIQYNPTSNVAVRLGNHWDLMSVYEYQWEQMGCDNYR